MMNTKQDFYGLFVTQIRIKHLTTDKHPCRATADVVLNEQLCIKGICINESQNGLYITFPRIDDKTVITLLTRELREHIETSVLEKYEAESFGYGFTEDEVKGVQKIWNEFGEKLELWCKEHKANIVFTDDFELKAFPVDTDHKVEIIHHDDTDGETDCCVINPAWMTTIGYILADNNGSVHPLCPSCQTVFLKKK